VVEKTIKSAVLSTRNATHLFEEAFFFSDQTFVHPTAIIGENVTLEDNVKIGPFCTVIGNVTIKSGTRLHPHATIGFPAQAKGVYKSLGTIVIGTNCEIREFATIHASRFQDGATTIGNNCYIMNYAHVGHDCTLEDNVKLVNHASLGGHTYLEHDAYIMAGSATHQFCRVGQFTALAPFSGIRQDVPPFCLLSGQPARFYGLNLVGLKRAGFSGTTISALKHVTKLFYSDMLDANTIITRADNEAWGQDEAVHTFLAFIQASTRGISRRLRSEDVQP